MEDANILILWCVDLVDFHVKKTEYGSLAIWRENPIRFKLLHNLYNVMEHVTLQPIPLPNSCVVLY